MNALLPRYFARSAADRRDDWPLWFVADREHGGINVTGRLFEQLTGEYGNGGVFLSRDGAERLARMANTMLPLNEGHGDGR